MRNFIIAGLVAGAFLTIGAPAAEAHGRNRRYVPQKSYVVFSPWGISWGQRVRQPRVRINESCVWKPWSNRTVCRY